MKFCSVTLGCKVNQYDTQAIESILISRGHVRAQAGQGCDVCIVNTCAVTGQSAGKSRQAVRRMRKLEPGALIAVCGCLSQLDPSSAESLGADLIGGSGNRGAFALEIEMLVQGLGVLETDDSSVSGCEFFEELPPGAADGRTRALLKIQDGCDNYCAYCVIPYARGRSRSLSPERAVEYARRLCAAGFCEIVVTGIEISSYGKFFGNVSRSGKAADNEMHVNNSELANHSCDSVSRSRDLLTGSGDSFLSCGDLAGVIRAISSAVPSTRLRLGSLDPAFVTESFCEELCKAANLCAHFHLSLQSGCDETLKRMGRRYTTGSVMAAISFLRRYFPDCGLTADLITGFPGETDVEFVRTLEFIEAAAFSDMHIFPFSPRHGTRAAIMPDQIAKSVRVERAHAATAVAAGMAREFKLSQIGKTADVLFERERGGFMLGHSGNYIEVSVKHGGEKNTLQRVLLTDVSDDGAVFGVIAALG